MQNYTFTFTAEEISKALDAKNQRALLDGNMLDAHRTSIARDTNDPHSESELRALLLEQPSPNPEYTGAARKLVMP